MPTPAAQPTVDVDLLGVPRFIGVNYIDLGGIVRVSRFRSGIGHSYDDSVETCRSLKHYFQPRRDVNSATLAIYAPITGQVTRVMVEQSFGTQVQITSDEQPAFTVILFHVAGLTVSEGARVTAGQRLGNHVGDQTMSDVAIRVMVPNGFRHVSWFEAITDALFESYRARGASSRESFVISRADRDASPLSCAGEAFANGGTLENWVDLR